jgi:hypothetical protein
VSYPFGNTDNQRTFSGSTCANGSGTDRPAFSLACHEFWRPLIAPLGILPKMQTTKNPHPIPGTEACHTLPRCHPCWLPHQQPTLQIRDDFARPISRSLITAEFPALPTGTCCPFGAQLPDPFAPCAVTGFSAFRRLSTTRFERYSFRSKSFPYSVD